MLTINLLDRNRRSVEHQFLDRNSRNVDHELLDRNRRNADHQFLDRNRRSVDHEFVIDDEGTEKGAVISKSFCDYFIAYPKSIHDGILATNHDFSSIIPMNQ